MPTVTLPAIGTVERKYVIGGAALVTSIVAYAYWKHRHTSSSATTAADAIDPLTGLPYSAETGQTAGYQNPNPDAVGAATVSGTAAITTDAQWTADVETKLTGLYDATFLINTLGKYLSGQPLTSDEALLIRAAWAASGHPPGNQQIILTTSNPQPGGTTTGPIVANRNNNLGVTIGSTNLHSWNDLARWAYWWPGHSNAADMHLNGLFGSLLAHANGQSGLTDPSKLKNIHLPDTLAGT